MKKVMSTVFFGIAATSLVIAGGGVEMTPETGIPDKVVVWSFADNNFSELVAREESLEAKFGVDFEFELVAQDAMLPRLQAAMMSGEDWPDIIDGPGSAIHLYASVNPADSVIIPLDAYIENSEIIEDVVWNRILKYQIGDHIYGLPNDIHPSVLIYNDDAWKNYGIDLDAVVTWDEFFQAATQLPDGVYAIAHRNLDVVFRMMVAQSGLQVVDESGVPNVDTPEMEALLTQFMEYYALDKMMAWDWGGFWDHMEQGRLLSSVAPDWWVGTAVARLTGGSLEGSMRAIPLPTVAPGAPRTAAWGGSFKAITKGAENPDFMYDVLEELQYSEEAVINRYRDTGIIAPMSTWWDDPVFAVEFPVFGGQQVGLLETQLATELPFEASGLGPAITWTAILEQFGGLVQGKDVATVLKGIQETAMQNYTNATK
jgi:ABC-type glycerol-3-phosphate transport system substrate-binding protein